MQTSYHPARRARITVIGDVILDRYVHGTISRISPEAPVPVIRVEREEERAGGAANVALNISRLGVSVQLLGITGDDVSAVRLQAMLAEQAVACDLLQQDDFPTITKIRVVSQNQQLLRMDYEESPQTADGSALLGRCLASLDDSDLLVLSDYAKGSLQCVPAMIEAARERDIPMLVDPKGGDFERYRGATTLTPNIKEFEAVAGCCQTEQDLVDKAHALCHALHISSLLITRGSQGISLIEPAHDRAWHLPAVRQEVFDVTGAGDTVIATYAAAIASGYAARQAVDFANHAAGIVITRIGTASVTAAELNSALCACDSTARSRLTAEEVIALVRQAKAAGERIVFTNGCFDIIHAGHIACLQQARQAGHRLVVALNDDASVRRLKGAGRPVNSLQHRAEVLLALEAVDWVVPFGEDTPLALLKMINPDVLVKGGDYHVAEIVGAEYVLANGGAVNIIPRHPGLSTTALIAGINSKAAAG